MNNLIAANTVGIIIGVVVGIIVLSVAMHFINRSFRVRYKYNLAIGGFFSLLSLGGIIGGALLLPSAGAVGYVLIVAGIIILVPLLIVCFKRCGAGGGIAAFFLQIIFCVPSILFMLSMKSRTGFTTNTYSSRRERRIIQQQREQRGYDNRNGNGYDNRYNNNGYYNDRNRRY